MTVRLFSEHLIEFNIIQNRTVNRSNLDRQIFLSESKDIFWITIDKNLVLRKEFVDHSLIDWQPYFTALSIDGSIDIESCFFIEITFNNKFLYTNSNLLTFSSFSVSLPHYRWRSNRCINRVAFSKKYQSNS